jgi:mannose-6-phosphate isomerase-like protein (cupin superfamily)
VTATPPEPDGPLVAIRRRLEQTEGELERMGYTSERMVTHPGTVLSQQLLDREILILVLSGLLHVVQEAETYDLGPGERGHVPSGIPFSIRAGGDRTVYWIHATRPEVPRKKADAAPSN